VNPAWFSFLPTGFLEQATWSGRAFWSAERRFTEPAGVNGRYWFADSETDALSN
jgi:hypothetical protein